MYVDQSSKQNELFRNTNKIKFRDRP